MIQETITQIEARIIKSAPPIGGGGSLGAYRTVIKEDAKKRMVRGVPAEKQQELLPNAWFDAWHPGRCVLDWLMSIVNVWHRGRCVLD